jgi:hypothetical protein
MLERARHGAASLLRIIDRDKGTQEFVALPADKDYVDLLLDGCTFIFPATDTLEERAAVIRQFDDAWRAEQGATPKRS